MQDGSQCLRVWFSHMEPWWFLKTSWGACDALNKIKMWKKENQPGDQGTMWQGSSTLSVWNRHGLCCRSPSLHVLHFPVDVTASGMRFKTYTTRLPAVTVTQSDRATALRDCFLLDGWHWCPLLERSALNRKQRRIWSINDEHWIPWMFFELNQEPTDDRRATLSEQLCCGWNALWGFQSLHVGCLKVSLLQWVAALPNMVE